ncbi:sugar ABC transporter ATP-binding protein [Bacillus sp. ISL-40]|nr:sugar ABC transporter ATP-binding protein [Bacillus sp. ISL-40]MBT2722969.1 sugar ABC transporter ATP-binding protein [Bacillus sp. ISL-46]MBT2740852.1 sugar ABC transporter ATP-binding protein [Bacillus sp. ISL-77]
MKRRSENIINFENISKTFPGVKALKGVNFSIQKGEIHALLGENGAGKSTLLNILHGVYAEYEGVVKIDHAPVSFKNTDDAIKQGIAKVHQEVNLIPHMTIGQNIALGYEPRKGPFIDFKKIHKKANELLEKLNCKFRSEDLASELSTGEMQMVQIAKALYHNAKVISFDEPTASLTTNETDALFKIIHELKNNGITILYVSHRLNEIFEICDRATVLRDGTFIQTLEIADITKEDLIRYMVGRDVAAFAVRTKPSNVRDEVVLEVDNLSINGVYEPISFHLKKGEILGFAGLVGAKRTDVVRTIFGADQKDSGTIKINGKTVEIKSPTHALKFGIGLIPENRKTQGYIKNFDNAKNTGIASLDKFLKYGFVSYKRLNENCDKFMKEIDLNPKDPNYLTNDLSGGNQQKVILSKWLSSDADILILDEPTKGVDVGAKAEIYRVLEDLIEKGKSIIVVSSELPEIIGLCDRVVVMREGKKVTELKKDELNEERILQYAMGVSGNV